MLSSFTPLTDRQAGRSEPINVHRPLLPKATAIAAYLSEIDERRWYSNWGPVVCRFEEKLADFFNVGKDKIITVSNGTLGLTLALMALGVPAGSLCIMPSWTFTATPLAAISAGLTPYFVDVERESWAITPDIVRQAIRSAPGPVGAIMPVVPFGQSMSGEAWDALSDELGIPVVIDAAAAVDTWRPTRSPAMVSLHATKLLGISEGGLIVTTDASLVKEIRRRANFGFDGSRETQVIALNAKLSEYHAAVGLAALDGFAVTREKFLSVAQDYLRHFESEPRIRIQAGFGTEWIATTFNVLLPDHSSHQIAESFARHGIETRAWWGNGAHLHKAFIEFPHTALPHTEWLAEHTLGLPFSCDLSSSDVGIVAHALKSMLG